MKITKPEYYDVFRCIAGACPDSCCKEWAVQVDAEAAAFYRGLPGELGDRLRQVLRDEDGETVMSIIDGRCPMWRQDGLCRIHAELGEEALCHVCGKFPRLRHEYGDFVELGLELSCPEAARLILNAPNAATVSCETEEPEDESYDREAMDSLLSTRANALAILDGEGYTPGQKLAQLLIYGSQAQGELDGDEPEPFEADAALEAVNFLARPAKLPEFTNFFLHLEILTERWKDLLGACGKPQLPPQTTALARYLVQRYWLQAISDYDLACRVKFVVISCLLVGMLPGDYSEMAQLFSKEIENDADNVDAILDAAYSCAAFTDDRLLGMLRMAESE